jgi:phenylpyruvate tautomerase PptA (4-oxalocrotonate tautomerase family)
MPSTRIVTGPWAIGREMELIEAVQSALQSAIKIPEWDRDAIVDLCDGTRRAVPTGNSERFTRVEIELISGRSIEAKRNLYRAIVERLAVIGVPELEIRIILIEIPMQNWGIQGGVPASESGISFKVDV